MASLREIRRKIKSVKSTQQITKAMKMVAAARLRKAQMRIISARPFALKMEQMMQTLLSQIDSSEEMPLFTQRSGPRRILLLVTSDKGLCGAFNTNLIRQALQYLKKYGRENVRLYIVGKKGRDYFRANGAAIGKEYIGIFAHLSFAHAEIIAQDLTAAFIAEPLAAVDILFNEFKSVMQQRVVTSAFLPLKSVKHETKRAIDFLFEPSRDQFLEAIIPRFLKAQIYRILLESQAAELGARMTAMENATTNARELLTSLTLGLNRTRQASITKEILEVVGGAEAQR